jgi:hypothetical protein
MSACDHCLSGCSDDGRGLDDEGYGPCLECFHVDQGDHDEGNHLGMSEVDDPLGPTSCVDIPRELAVVPIPTGVGTHSSSKSVRCRPRSTRKQGGLCSSDRTSNRSGQAEHSPEEPVIRPKVVDNARIDACGRPRSIPSARGTRHLPPGIASVTSITITTIEPASTRRCSEATIPGAGGAATARRIGAPRPSHPVHESSAGPYDERRSRPFPSPDYHHQVLRGDKVEAVAHGLPIGMPVGRGGR